MAGKKVHWTQRPENTHKVASLGKKRRARRGSKVAALPESEGGLTTALSTANEHRLAAENERLILENARLREDISDLSEKLEKSSQDVSRLIAVADNLANP